MRTLIGVMRIPPSASIPVEKIADYLLRPRQIDDKSRFLIWLEWAADGSFHFVTLKPLKRTT
jgi:hypothetical protein